MKRLLVVISILLFLFAGLWTVGSLLVDERAYSERLYQQILDATGYKAEAKDVSVSLFPSPAITFHHFSVANPPHATGQHFLQAEKLVAVLDVASLLGREVQVGEVRLVYPQLELERLSDGEVNWAFVHDPAALEGVSLSLAQAVIQEGRIRYKDRLSGQNRELSDVNGELEHSAGGYSRWNGVFQFQGATVSVEGNAQMEHLSSLHDFAMRGEMSLRQQENYLHLKGRAGQEHALLHYDGQVSLKMREAGPWIQRLVMGRKQEVSPDVSALPVDVTSSLAVNKGRWQFSDLEVAVGESKGKGTASYDSRRDSQLLVDVAFDQAVVQQSMLEAALSDREMVTSLWNMLFPRALKGALQFTMGQLGLGQMDARQVRMYALLNQGELVVTGSCELAGKARLVASGIVKRDPEGNVHFDGNMELLGKRLSAFASPFGPRIMALAKDYDGAFRVKANLFLSQAHSIISELKFRAGALRAAGSATFLEDSQYDAEISLRMSGMKLDPLLDLVAPERVKAGKTEFEDALVRIPWLDDFSSTLAVRLSLQDSHLLGKNGVSARLNLGLAPGWLQLSNSHLAWGDVTYKGSLLFDQTDKEMSVINIDLQMNRLDLAPLVAAHLRKVPVEGGYRGQVWSQDNFDFSALKGYDATIRLNIDQLQHPDYPMQNALLIAEGQHGAWNVEQFRAALWGGAAEFKGKLDITSVPRFSSSFSMQSVHPDRVLNALAGHRNFAGQMNLSGQVSMSGLNAHNWIRNMTGNIVLRGRDIAVKGFDVAALVQAVPAVRSVAGLVNTVRTVLLRSRTVFSVVEGSFYIEKGILKTHGLNLRSHHATGKVTGEIDLTRWMIDAGIEFALITLTRAEYPSLGIVFRDSLDAPEVTLDTRSLEAYVAKTTVH